MYFKQFVKERNIQQETIRGYKGTIKKYEEYYDLSIDDLINEAIDEENDINLPKRSRSIKQRLQQFRTHLSTETDLKYNTIVNHMNRLITLYSHFDVELPKLPKMQKDEPNEITYYDLPTKEQIGMAVDMAGLKIGSLILFMASSGTGRTECSNMTIEDFINGCRDYITVKTDDLKEILEDLYGSLEPIVPTLYLYRQKTKKQYYTFCTPEASHKIIEWLLLRIKKAEVNEETISLQDKIWDLTGRQIDYHFQHINDELGFGFKGSYRFFRPHTLRKFHASNIGLSEDNIDLLQGRSRDRVHETYIKTNPQKFKQTYITVMENVTIGKTNKEIHHEEFTININLNFYGYSQSVTL